AVRYRGGDVYSFGMNYLGLHDTKQLATLGKIEKQKLRNALVGLEVSIKGGNGRARKVTEIIWEGSKFTFPLDKQADFCQEHFNNKGDRLRYPNLFALAFRRDKSNVIPGEKCDIVEGQFAKKILHEQFAREMISFSAKKPNERLQLIQQGMGTQFLNYRESDFMAGISVSQEPMIADGRFLCPPQLRFGNQAIVDNRATRGVWNYMRRTLYRPSNYNSPFGTVVINYIPNVPTADIKTFAAKLIDVCKSLGQIRCYDPGFFTGNPHSPNQVLQEIQRQVNHRPQFVLVILPESAEEIRRAVKYWGDSECGVPTQCIRQSGLRKGLEQGGGDQYLRNVALKINVKMGGVNAIPILPDVNSFLRDGAGLVMVAGKCSQRADVTHPGAGVTNQPSYASLVCSTDPWLTRYSTFYRVQHPRFEPIEDLKNMMKVLRCSLPHIFVRAPKHIIFYRDGVSEGEYDIVKQHELKAIQDAFQEYCKEVGSVGKVELVFIVVGKRSIFRFISVDIRERGGKGNLYGGVVVCSGITSLQDNDFYLLSHPGLQGTSKPSHYIVLFNSARMPQHLYVNLSYYLCFVFARATRAVSIPAPVYCA
ncbi:Piwi domain-containing protein, partial [Vararia minispora EC-137]